MSLPVRGAWIEMRYAAIDPFTPRGRSPCGERGLKLSDVTNVVGSVASLPVRGAWIEMCKTLDKTISQIVSLPVRGAWIEMRSCTMALALMSRRSPCGERGLK